MKATYLLIKSSVLSVTDATKPIHIFSDAPNEDDSPMFQRAMNTFYKTFIKVDNPEVAIRAITAPIQNKVTGLYDDGLYPVDGIEFEVNECDKPCSQACTDLGKCGLAVAVVSLIDAKEKEQSGEPATAEKISAGNEAKKEEQLFTKEDLRTAFEAGESHYDFENWFIEKFD